jgi:hypothetical protein
MKGTRVPRIALKLPRMVALLIIFVQHVVEAMTNSPWFASLAALLVTTTADLAALQEAEALVLTRAKGAVEARDDKKKVILDDLALIKSGVQVVVNKNPGQAAAIIASAGLFQAAERAPHKPNLAARTTVTPGEVLVRAKAVKDAAYEWQRSGDAGRTWDGMGITTVADTSATGLTVGASYLFRFRTTVKKATSDWSPSLPFIVT